MYAHRFFPNLAFWRFWCGLCLAGLLGGFAPTAGAQQQTRPLVLAAADSAPTAYFDNGKPAGLLVDVLEEASKRSGYSIKVRLLPWARCLLEVKEGKVDGIFSVYLTPERQEFLSYTDEVLITQVQALFVRKDASITFDGNLKKLSDMRIGIVNQTSYGPRLDAALSSGVFKTVEPSNSAASNVMRLVHDRVDVIPSYRHVVLHTAKTMGLSGELKELTPAVEAIPSYLAFSNKRDRTKEIAAFNQALRSMKKDGTYDAIFNKYLGGH